MNGVAVVKIGNGPRNRDIIRTSDICVDDLGFLFKGVSIAANLCTCVGCTVLSCSPARSRSLYAKHRNQFASMQARDTDDAWSRM